MRETDGGSQQHFRALEECPGEMDVVRLNRERGRPGRDCGRRKSAHFLGGCVGSNDRVVEELRERRDFHPAQDHP